MKKTTLAIAIVGALYGSLSHAKTTPNEDINTGVLVVNGQSVVVEGMDKWDVLLDTDYHQLWSKMNGQWDTENNEALDVYLEGITPNVDGYSLYYRAGVRYNQDAEDDNIINPEWGPTLGAGVSFSNETYDTNLGIDYFMVEGGDLNLTAGVVNKDMFRTGSKDQWSFSPGIGGSFSLTGGGVHLGPSIGVMNLEYGKGFKASMYGVSVSEIVEVAPEQKEVVDYHAFPLFFIPIIQELFGMRSALDVIGMDFIPDVFAWVANLFKDDVDVAEKTFKVSDTEALKVVKVGNSVTLEKVWLTSDGSCLKTRFGGCWKTGE